MAGKKFEHVLPKEGIALELPDDKSLTEIKLGQIDGGISLAVVGSASAPSEGRHRVRLDPIENGITLSVVGSASAATK